MPNANSYAAKVYQALPDDDTPIRYRALSAKLDDPVQSALDSALIDLIDEGVIRFGDNGVQRVRREFTVIGIIIEATGQLVIAGAIIGDHSMVDVDTGEFDGFTRWADTFMAHNASEAQEMALAQVEEPEDEGKY